MKQKLQDPSVGFSEFMDIDQSLDPVNDFLAKLTSSRGDNIYPETPNETKKNLATVPATLDTEQSQMAPAYSERTHANLIDSQYNAQLSFRGKDDNTENRKADIQPIQPPIEEYRYMFEKIRNKSEVLDDRIDYIADVINQAYQLDNDYGNPCRATQNTITAVGRICCDASEGKLNDKSILLETSRTLGMGKRVKLDISQVNEYTLFPGQIIAVEGTNKTGKSFTVDKILLPPFPENLEPVTDENKAPNDRITEAIIASGPYTLDTDLSFNPLEELLETCRNEQPDVLILMGPFLSVGHPLIASGQLDELPEDIFQNQISNRLNVFAESQPNIQVLLMPHANDIIQDWPLFPQPKLNISELNIAPSPTIQSISNPSILDINGSLFAIANVDILRSLGTQEIAKSNTPSDRLANLSRHILQQHTFYPLFPPSGSDAIDADQMAYLQISAKPDFLVMPSQLKHFTKLVDDVLCINPGHLCKGRSGGTFVRLAIHPSDPMEASPTSDRTRVDLVKI
ncbi:unnamed protein product [Absidia cylindrospora]